jgi:hypothetical protein
MDSILFSEGYLNSGTCLLQASRQIREELCLPNKRFEIGGLGKRESTKRG